MASSFVRAVRIACLPVALLAAACGNSSSNTSGSGADGPGGPGTGASGGSGAQGGSGNESVGGSGNASTGGGGAGSGCTSDADCTVNPAEPKCDVSTGECVGCLPGNDTCPTEQYCDPATNTCTVGCTDESDCPDPDLTCDTQKNKCVGCVLDTDCPSGSICISNTCVPGCSGSQPCQPGFTCCSQKCFDVAIDVANCGQCSFACAVPPNAEAICSNGVCGIGLCNSPYDNCDGDQVNGCEQNTLQDGQCVCNPGDTQPCYQGSPGTENVGPCHGGTQTCKADGLGWGGCVGQVLPAAELCANGIDEDCDTILDNGADQDNDGWGMCDGDCCDTAADGCSSPKLVNPGAYEFIGNMIDDDCDPTSSDTVAVPDCSTAAKFSGVLGDDIAKAMDLCQFTTANLPPPVKKWGVISASQLLANGGNPSATQLSNMQNFADAILVNYGTGGVVPVKGPTMAGLSSGRMRDENDAGYTAPNGGTSWGSSSQPPAPYLAAHGGSLPSSAGCSGNCPAGSGANDSTNVKLTIRVPTNAQSFSYSFRFFSAEYWTYQCTSFNDFYLALIQTGAPGIPADKNISFDGSGNPVSVNNGFFDVCAPKGCNTCPAGTGALAGTGMQIGNTGGGTKWLTTDAPIVPGETMVLELMVFDVSDTILDSLVLLDKFVWNIAPAQVGTHE